MAAPVPEVIPGVSVNLGDVTVGTIDIVRALRNNFMEYLEDIGKRKDYHFNHPGLNCRYGIEMEFDSSANRYQIGNRVNSCMWAQNCVWWRRNFDALEGIGPSAISGGGGANPLEEDSYFDQWSSFFLEATENHGSSSHRGSEACENRKNAGPRIEDDSSVEISGDIPEIQLWSNNYHVGHKNTDIRKDGGDWRFSGFKSDNSENSSTPFSFTLHRKKPGRDWINGIGQWGGTNLHFYNRNELVSNVLANVHVKYPYLNQPGHGGGQVTNEGLVPLGSILIDNLMNHMKGHGIVLATQDMGFHIHLSEYPRIADADKRKTMIIGFVKLFYLFEPLFYSFQPIYRSESRYCQSIQSIFTFDDILGVVDEHPRTRRDLIWEDLVNNVPIGGDGNNRREFEDTRYVSLNLKNCQPGGIGTIEVRLGHSTFDSTYIQAYTNLLQTLLRVNMSMIEYDSVNHRRVYQSHDAILSGFEMCIPYYCKGANYNVLPDSPFEQINVGNNGRPVRGFFNACGFTENAKIYKRNIITTLIECMEALTCSNDMLEYLVFYTNYYHTIDSAWLCKDSLGSEINFETTINVIRDAGFDYNPLNSLRYIFSGENMYNYTLFEDEYSVKHACKTCSKNGAHECKPDYGPIGDYSGPERKVAAGPARDAQLRDESTVYKKTCPRVLKSKIQSELINWKTSQLGGHEYNQFGGTRRRSKKGGRKTRKQKQIGGAAMEKPRILTREELFERSYKTTKGATPINVEKTNDGNFDVSDIDWMGNLTKDSGLSKVVNALITRKVINEEELTKMADESYIGRQIFQTKDDLHRTKLVKEMGEKFGFSKDKIDQIRAIYDEFPDESRTVSSEKENLTRPLQLNFTKRVSNTKRKMRKTRKVQHK